MQPRMFPRPCHACGHALVVLDTHSADTEPLRSARGPGRGDRGFFTGDTSAQIFVVKIGRVVIYLRNSTKLALTCIAVTLAMLLFSIFSSSTINISISLTPTASSTAEAAPASNNNKAASPKNSKKSNDQIDIAFELAPELKTPRGLLNEIFILSRKLDALRKEYDDTEEVVMSLIRTNMTAQQSYTANSDITRLEQRISAIEGRLFSIEAILKRR